MVWSHLRITMSKYPYTLKNTQLYRQGTAYNGEEFFVVSVKNLDKHKHCLKLVTSLDIYRRIGAN